MTEADLCTVEYPNDDNFAGQICELPAGHKEEHRADIPAGAHTMTLCWPNRFPNGVCTFGEDAAPGAGCIKPAGHDGAHYVTPGDTDDEDLW